MSALISFPDALFADRSRCASSATTRSHPPPVSSLFSGSLRAAASETSSTGPPPRQSGTPLRAVTMDVGRLNLRSNSSRHCSTRPAGVSTSVRSAKPRNRSSERIKPASMVLPSPTSSARIARPRMRRSTVDAVSR